MAFLFRMNFKKLVTTIIFSLSFFNSTIFATEREDIINFADEYTRHDWSCTEYNVNYEEYATYGCSEHQKCDYTPGSYTGVAYGYGFDDTIDNQNIEKGDILGKAGSHVVIVDYLSNGIVYLYETTGNATTEFPHPNARYTNRTLQSFIDNGYTARSKFIPSTGIEPGEGEIFTYSPTALVATTGANQISLSWTASSDYVDGYYIYRGTQSNRASLYADVGNVTNYTDTDVINGYTYYYKVSVSRVARKCTKSGREKCTTLRS